MKFSIIVPVYNVEKYLEECLNSLLEQKFKDYEIILVNDGSTDNSGKICQHYSNLSDKIKVYNKSNEGLSCARNLGIEKSSGDFLIFVDSDDFIKKDILEDIASKINKETEILITRFVESFPNDINIKRDNEMEDFINEFPTKTEALNWILNKSYNTWPAQKYIISRKFIYEFNLRFRKYFLHEDLEWTSYLCIYCNKFQMYTHEWYYHRMERKGSITNVINSKRVTDVIKMSYDLIYGSNSKKLNRLSKKEKNMIINRVMESFYPSILKCVYMDEKSVDTVANELDKRKKILKNTSKIKYKIFVFFIKILGLKKTIKMLRILMTKEKYNEE